MSDLIQMAKDASSSLKSPPRIYSTSGNSANSWPNHPGSAEVSFATRGIYRPQMNEAPAGEHMTLTTTMTPGDDPNSWMIVFQSTWNQAESTKRHAWKFRVHGQQTTFLGEEGDELPPLPM